MNLIINTYSVFVTIVSCTILIKSSLQYDLDRFYNVSGRIYRPGIDGCDIPIQRNDPRRPTPHGLGDPRDDHFPMRESYRANPGEFLRFACDSGRIMKTHNEVVAPEIILQCKTNNSLAFREETVYYDDFTCEEFPSFADMRVKSSVKRHLKRDIGGYDCFLSMHGVDYFQPVPFTTNTTEPMIIHPDMNGNLVINRNDYFKLACTGRGNEFMSPRPRGRNEALVKCLNGTYLEYRNNVHTFFDFTCAMMPKAELELTNVTCYNRRHNVFEVGYQTHFHFLPLYRICFDMVYKNAKYSWFFANTPVYPTRQIPKISKLKYIDTKVYGDEIVPFEAYYNQTQSIRRILRSTKMAKYYVAHDQGRMLVPGHLAAEQAFVYAFEQWATYYYENTVPQWYLYNRRVWKDMQKVLNDKLAHDYTRHLIVTGVMDMCHLLERPNRTHPIYLSLPWSISVPKYIWRMDYDMDRKNGTVYIGLNNPYKRIDMDVYFCEAMPCPTKLLGRKAFEKDLLFCCTKQDFERTYGPIDPVVFQDF